MSRSVEIASQDQSFSAEDLAEPVPPLDIVAYNELRSCADLFRLHTSAKLEIQPDFQRDVVWKQDDQSRFIDSLVKQLPIPSMCFSLDHKTQRWKVIDGLQRMSSIIHFLSQSKWALSSLPDIHPELRGRSNTELREGSDQQRRLYSLVEDVSIPITVIRCDYSQQSHMRYLFTIFHRLNSGGVRLTNQEIRNCIYTGPFNDLLKRFDKHNADWIAVKKRIWGSMDRFRSVEVLLRVLALGDWRARYDGNLARFLNDYMQSRSGESGANLAEIERVLGTIAALSRETLKGERLKKIPSVTVEAVLVALYIHRESLSTFTSERLTAAYSNMLSQVTFTASARYAVTSSDNMRLRLDTAIKAFAE